MNVYIIYIEQIAGEDKIYNIHTEFDRINAAKENTHIIIQLFSFARQKKIAEQKSLYVYIHTKRLIWPFLTLDRHNWPIYIVDSTILLAY